MRYHIFYLPTAETDMREIRAYYQIKSLPSFDKVAASIRAKILMISERPMLYPVYAEDRRFRRAVAGNYLIFYVVDEENESIEIHHIWHGMRNISKELRPPRA